MTPGHWYGRRRIASDSRGLPARRQVADGVVVVPRPADREDARGGRHAGSDNLPPCNKATIHIKIDGPTGSVTLKHSLFLHSKTEGLLSAFFAAIGQKKKGEPLRMNWAKVIGSKGLCKISQYQGDDGNIYNEVKRFLPSEDRQESSGWQPGKF